MPSNENLTIREQRASQIANDLILDIASGAIQKDILMNSAQDFSGDVEANYIENYRNYLRSASYLMDKRIRA